MKKLLTAILISLVILGGFASNTGKFHFKDINVNKGTDLITLNMTVDAKESRLGSNEIVTLTPMFVAGSDTLYMTPVRVAGKKAWYVEMRENPMANKDLVLAGTRAPVDYSCTADMDSRFDNSEIVIKASTENICNCKPKKGSEIPYIYDPVGKIDFRKRELKFSFNYVAPTDSAEKTFELSGKANVIFKVNRTEIDWSYAGNHAELDTILKTINVVRDNKDATVQGIYLKGFASPEGSYANNVRLAKGRTEAVKDYVMDHSSFPESVYHTSYVAEDWEGLLSWLETNYIPQRDEMIEFIKDSSIPEKDRNDIFSRRFPTQYAVLLRDVYPSLRHTDYRIKYKVRKYYDVDEIREVMRTNPRNLSLNELFLLANSMTPGSVEYDEVFELAARLYPESAIANLNAANSAMNRGNLKAAGMYLERAGDSPEADYARAVLMCLNGNYDEAEPLLKRAEAAGVAGAAEALQELKNIKDFNGEVIIY